MSTLQTRVKIDEPTHIYYNDDGEEYTSVTRIIKQFASDPNFDMLAGQTAIKRKRIFEEQAIANARSIESIALSNPMYKRGYTKEQVLKEWDAKRDAAASIGTHIHKGCEKAGKFGIIENDRYKHYYEWCAAVSSQYKYRYFEAIVYSEIHKAAGTIDFSYFRGKRAYSGMFNIRDFKTNPYMFDSSRIDEYTGDVKHYNAYLKAPLDHLEQCDFTKYVLQQSIYMYMVETQFGIKPGNCGIINMPWENIIPEPTIQHLPYMRSEARTMLNEFKPKNIEYDEVLSVEKHDSNDDWDIIT